ncbi:hypothetical protein CLM62_47015 [Streptomyces sp. SA15]|uniref:hypothetical protein n=1 Tax=Streptomyces sp. SA15 TaxID=934019 RepID=UPI000BAF620A|nr:hypothetical protein [Streptomyces sp. SA15]PAZ09322.1 hypothetical protein CLM62_47015 [Streptomyces sp. SA15]
MHTFMVVTAATLASLLVVLGIAGIAFDWVVPWARKKVLRPRLSGYGMLVGGVGFALFDILGPLDRAFGPLSLVGWFMFMAGLFLSWMSQRPGRAS